MRIAFVGKGGSGKTTATALFTHYLKKQKKNILAIDADINMHYGELIGFNNSIPKEKHLSHPLSTKYIKTYLKGNNHRIKELSHFRKTTPPTKESRLISIDKDNDIIQKFALNKENIYFMSVGTYDSESIGASCYHNNLAILEIILSHTLDKNNYVTVDMVAGTDAFANTLHAQFDLLVLIIEPTKKGIEVYKQYSELAKSANVEKHLAVLGNKIRTKEDIDFLTKNLPKSILIGYFKDSDYLRKHDQTGGELDLKLLERENLHTLELLFNELSNIRADYGARLKKLHNIHNKYVSQDFIKERFGDLTNQIDPNFDYGELENGKET